MHAMVRRYKTEMIDFVLVVNFSTGHGFLPSWPQKAGHGALESYRRVDFGSAIKEFLWVLLRPADFFEVVPLQLQRR